MYHTRAFADEHGHWPAVPLAVRAIREVVGRTLRAFDALYAVHHPPERAQHLKILRVLRFMVPPEMTRRLMGG